MTYLVTGAGRGLGFEITKQLLDQNRKVVAWVRNSNKIDQLNELSYKFNDQLKIQCVDISQSQSISEAVSKLNRIDVLINNAGVCLDMNKNLSYADSEIFEKTFDVNLKAPYLITQALMPLLKNSDQAMIVHISTILASLQNNTTGDTYIYKMSKAALNMFTQCLSVEFPNIKSLCIHPGWVKTDMGGPNAMISTSTSVTGLLQIMNNPEKYKSGAFIDYRGRDIRF